MTQKETTFFMPASVKLGPGVSFFGSIEIALNPDDTAGWWVKSVMAYDSGCNRELSEKWAKMVREAVDRDTALCDEITGIAARIEKRTVA